MTRPEFGFAFGRVPDFSLLPDGNVYYLDPAEWDKVQVMTARLAPAETEALIQRVLDLSFERLESYTDLCQPQGGDTCLCVADAGESVFENNYVHDCSTTGINLTATTSGRVKGNLIVDCGNGILVTDKHGSVVPP